MPRILVVGSTNLDLVATADHLPVPGETVTRASLERHRGGKGANQALAAARFGVEVSFVGAVGDDPEADFALALLGDAGVNLDGVVRVPEVPTGTALIMVGADGENQIMVASGANAHLRPDHVDAAGYEAVLVQFEIPEETVAEAIRQATGLVVVNVAPARPLPPGWLGGADIVIANEGEYAVLEPGLRSHEGTVIRTLGATGAEALQGGDVIARVPAPSVQAIDTVGAGDAFCGVFTAAMASGQGLEEAMTAACAAGAIATTRPGVQSALPSAEEIATLRE